MTLSQNTPVRKIPATVITGFLGAGKTTLIRHLLGNARGRRLALIVNEFGEVGIDGELLKACGSPDCTDDDIVELANGCLCFTVADDFLPTLQKLLDRADPPDHIAIETPRLALPQPLVQPFAWRSQERPVWNAWSVRLDLGSSRSHKHKKNDSDHQ